MGEAEEVQEKMKAENGSHKRANGHNDEGHDEHEEDNGSQCGYNRRY